jgi:hypothetical protein
MKKSVGRIIADTPRRGERKFRGGVGRLKGRAGGAGLGTESFRGIILLAVCDDGAPPAGDYAARVRGEESLTPPASGRARAERNGGKSRFLYFFPLTGFFQVVYFPPLLG